MYTKKYETLNSIGPSFEDLSDEEMQTTDGGFTPTITVGIPIVSVIAMTAATRGISRAISRSFR